MSRIYSYKTPCPNILLRILRQELDCLRTWFCIGRIGLLKIYTHRLSLDNNLDHNLFELYTFDHSTTDLKDNHWLAADCNLHIYRL